MSASAIADGLVTLLGSASVFGVGRVRKNSYEVLETSASSCCVIQWIGLNSDHTTFGNPYSPERTWDMKLDVYVRDTGNSQATMDRVWTVTDMTINALDSDPTIQGTVDMIRTIRARRDPNQFAEIGGAVWLPSEWTISVVEYV